MTRMFTLHEALVVGKLTSGPTFKARTVSLCSQSLADAVKRTHRICTFNFCASFTQIARVSGSALVLSEGCCQSTAGLHTRTEMNGMSRSQQCRCLEL